MVTDTSLVVETRSLTALGLRTERGWSLGQLARQAGLSKAALSQWEAGRRQPRVAELEAVLDVLEASPTQRARAFAGIAAPRAVRHLRQKSVHGGLGPPPTAGDLLQALRLRQGCTQAEAAARVGVNDSSVARWERGERLPSTEQMQALCYALGAREEELVALTRGEFARSLPEEPTTWEEKQA
ncbi:MAG TPA: helix-turn-helix transcriptional regulator [Chthonomonadaceae bacterium]|nr:helix-turn-helix transcriptional regulator [Chthonomonadaceae bacterium]